MPSAQYPLPNWIQPADEASNLARGIQLGESQARQRLLEKQQQFQEQQAAVDQARADMQFKAQSEDRARKFAAQQAYQRRVAAGEDPLKVLVELGPGMGQQQTAESAAIRAMALQNKPQVPPFVPGPVQAFPVMDPTTGKPIPEFVATPSPTGKAMTVHLRQKAAELSPTTAANLLSKLPDLEAVSPGITTNIQPALLERVKSVAGKKSEAPKAKEIIRFTKDGKKAVFDAETKEFIRYAD